MITREEVADLSCLLATVSLRQANKNEPAAMAALAAALCAVARHIGMTTADVQSLVAEAYAVLQRPRRRRPAAGGRPS